MRSDWCDFYASKHTCLLTTRFLCFQSKYKSLLISERTTVDQMIQLVLNCYNSTESVNLFSIYEVRSCCSTLNYIGPFLLAQKHFRAITSFIVFTASHRALLLKNSDHVALLRRLAAAYGDSTTTIFVKTRAHFAAAVICRRLLLRDLPIQVCHTNSFERKLHADDRPSGDPARVVLGRRLQPSS